MMEPKAAAAPEAAAPEGVREITAPVVRVRGGTIASSDDVLAVERPLEIRARIDGEVRVVSTTMRTPGDDRELAAGFLYAERVITGAAQIRALESLDEDTVLIELAPNAAAALQAAQRPFITNGACGVCGRATLDGVRTIPRRTAPPGAVPPAVVSSLPDALRAAQATFARTGGLHAAGLFAADGALLVAYEDVGRHNAVDKLVGARLLGGHLPDADGVLVVSGRASFELAQKAAVAGFGTLVAVGAPSSLAVEVAREAGMTLIGFARADGFNIYCGAERVEGISERARRPMADRRRATRTTLRARRTRRSPIPRTRIGRSACPGDEPPPETRPPHVSKRDRTAAGFTSIWETVHRGATDMGVKRSLQARC